jgi:hypothetical protein
MGNTNEKPETDQARAKVKDCWDKIDIIGRVVVAPLMVVLIGLFGQAWFTRKTITADYLKLAVSILTAPSDNVDPGLRTWAGKLVTKYSPTEFSPGVEQQIISGTVSFPSEALEGLPELYEAFPQWSDCYKVIPEGDLSFDPESPASVGTKITVTANTTWGECRHLMRLRIDGLTVFPTDQSQDTYIWDTSNASKGGHILRLEVVPQFTSPLQELMPEQEITPGQEITPWWFTVLELIYTLT